MTLIKKLNLLTILLLTPFLTNAQEWNQIDSYPGLGRNHPITFSIGDYGYVLAGQNENELFTKDFYRYDSTNDTWEQLPNFTGFPRGYSYGIAHDEKAYVGFGKFDMGPLNDWWTYDPVTEEWTQLEFCPCDARLHPAMLEAGGKIYVGLGATEQVDLKDWWAYDIDTDSWEQRADFPAEERHHPYFFSLDDIAYVGFGHGGDFIYNDFYKYDPEVDEWTQVASLPSQGRVAGTQFNFEGKGYALSGDGEGHGYMETGEFWQYDPALDQWNSKPPHPGLSVWAPGCFVIGSTLYFTSGMQYDDWVAYTHNNVWTYDLSTIDVEEPEEFQSAFFPNPTRDFVNLPSFGNFEVHDVKGALVLSGNSRVVDITFLKPGTYIISSGGIANTIIKE